VSTYTAAYSDASINDNARFRTFGDFISTSLQSAGWTQTGDTGQIDWATVSAPGGASTFMGYEILYSDNTAGPRLYMKIEYGSGYNSAAKGFRVNFGTGSDGSGNLTGGSAPTGGNFSEPSNPGLLMPSPGLAIFSAAGYAAAAGDDYISGSSARFGVACCDDSNQTFNTAFGVCRTHDTSGNDTDQGWILWNFSYNNVGKVLVMHFDAAGKTSHWVTDSPPPQMYLFRHVGDATHIPVKPIYWHGYESDSPLMPLRDVVAMPTALAADRTDHTFTHVGASRTFKAVYGNVTASTVWGVTAPAVQSLAMRYD
jgi:hypothetical protein